jgi:hypothetical protein
MTWKGTGIPPFFEKLIVEINSLFKLDKVGLPLHLTQKFSFIKLE